jgi:hypothetical protein
VKINESMCFPHPVLGPETGDYSSGEFNLEIRAVSEAFSTDQVTVDYSATLTEVGLLSALSSGTVSVGIFVTCLDTYYSNAIALSLGDGRFAFDPGALVGRVEIQPLIWARFGIPHFSLSNCHSEFGGGTMGIEAGEILALGELQVLNIGREKLAQTDTIFSIVKDETLADGQLSVNLDADRIQVLVAENIHQSVNDLRAKKFGHSIVLNGVYLPAVMQVLDILRAGEGDYEGRRWHRIFRAKCEYLGVNVQQPDLWRDAQILLNDPFSEIAKAKESWEG